MAKRIPAELKGIIARIFPNLTVSNTEAPQGQNSFSFNFLLEDTEGRSLLLKAIRLGSTDLEHPEEAIDEVKASSVVRSQYFIPLLDTQTSDGYAFLLFPFLRGENLADYLAHKGGTLSEEEIREIGISLLRGIADLSRHDIRHQDIKPANIFITDDGALKILDFGSARFKKESFRGSTRTNRSHSSPEQILATRPGNLESLRLTCDERSDVYAAGSILYELATGSPPFETNEEKLKGLPPPPIEREDISDGTKRIINRLLSFHPRFRPQATAAESFLAKGDVQAITVARGGFYYSASNSLKRLQEAHHDDQTLFDGLVIEASKIPASDQEYLRSGPLTSVIDPQTYLFQAPKLMNKKFKELPYYEYGVSGDEVGLEHITDDEGLINATLDFEISSGADMLVPPFLLVKEFNDLSWTRNAEMMARSVSIYRERKLQVPLLRGIAVAENILLSDTTRGRMIDHLTTTDGLSEAAGYYILLESTQRDGLPNEAWLKAAKELMVGLLSTGKVVIWGHAYLPSIVFAHSGIGLAMGEGQSQRSFNLNEDTPSIMTPSPHLYLPRLFARVKWPSGIQALNAQGYTRVQELACPEDCCEGVDFSNPSARDGKDLALHMIRQLGLQYKKYSGTNGATKEKEDLEFAKRVYEELRSSTNPLLKLAARNELKPESGAFLDNWLSAFHST